MLRQGIIVVTATYVRVRSDEPSLGNSPIGRLAGMGGSVPGNVIKVCPVLIDRQSMKAISDQAGESCIVKPRSLVGKPGNRQRFNTKGPNSVIHSKTFDRDPSRPRTEKSLCFVHLFDVHSGHFLLPLLAILARIGLKVFQSVKPGTCGASK